MYISCPNCATRYDIGAASLGSHGRTVRCSNCRQTWHQQPVASPPPGYAPQRQPQQAQPQYAPQYAQPAWGAAPQPQPAPTAGAAQPQPQQPPPQPQPAAAAPRPEPVSPIPEPEPEPEPEDEAEMQLLPDLDEDLAPEPETEDEGISQEDLDAMFADEEEPEPFQSLVRSEDTDDEDETSSDEEIAPEDFPDPEPIPQVFTSGDDEDEEDEAGGGLSIGKMAGIVAALLVIAVLSAGFLLRDMVVEMVPATQGFYDLVGLGEDELGAGLAIKNVQSSREPEGGVDVLVVRGVIENITQETVPVPHIRASLLDRDDQPVQEVTVTPIRNSLDANGTVGFKVRLPNPPPTARQLAVDFIPPPADGSAAPSGQ